MHDNSDAFVMLGIVVVLLFAGLFWAADICLNGNCGNKPEPTPQPAQASLQASIYLTQNFYGVPGPTTVVKQESGGCEQPRRCLPTAVLVMKDCKRIGCQFQITLDGSGSKPGCEDGVVGDCRPVPTIVEYRFRAEQGEEVLAECVGKSSTASLLLPFWADLKYVRYSLTVKTQYETATVVLSEGAQP